MTHAVIPNKVSELQSVELASILGILCLPKEMFGHIFHFLNAEELARIAPVCQLWETFASSDAVSSYGILFPSWLKDINEEVWEKYVDVKRYGLDVTGAPRVNRCTLTKALKPLSRKVENKMGITNMVIPKGLTLNIVLQIAKDNSVPIELIWGEALTNFGDIAVEQTRVLFFTNSIFEGTTGRAHDWHPSEVAKIGRECRIAIQMPELQNFIAFLVLTYISSSETTPTQLYSSNTLTRLIEKVGRWFLIGGFSSSGLCVDCTPSGYNGRVGVGASGNSADIGAGNIRPLA